MQFLLTCLAAAFHGTRKVVTSTNTLDSLPAANQVNIIPQGPPSIRHSFAVFAVL